MICPNCQKENKNTNIRCEGCGTELINVQEHLNKIQPVYTLNPTAPLTKEQKIKTTKTTGCIIKIILFFFISPFLFTGLALTIVGAILTIDERSKIENYVQTEATLVEYINCYISDGSEFCEGLYEYEVDGTRYTASPSKEGSRNTYSETETVYYNANNPSENLIPAGWTTLLIVGIIMVVASSSSIIIVTILNKKAIKKIENSSSLEQFPTQTTIQ